MSIFVVNDHFWLSTCHSKIPLNVAKSVKRPSKIKSEEINQREVQSDMEAPAAACANCKASVADYRLICILGGL